MKKAQMVFENFIVAFLFTFMFASSVFLVLGGGAGLDIDFFSRTIYDESKQGVDLTYVTVYEYNKEEEGYDINEDNFHYYESNQSVYYSFKRTGVSFGTNRLETEFYIAWDDCNSTYCGNKTNQEGQDEHEYTIGVVDPSLTDAEIGQGPYIEEKGAEKLQEYSFGYTIPDTKYSNCESNLTIGVRVVDESVNESILYNNYYNIEINHCFYPPTDLGIKSVSLPNVWMKNQG